MERGSGGGEIASIDHAVDHSGLVVLGVIGVAVAVVLVLLVKHSLDDLNPCLDVGGQCVQ